MDTEQTSKNIFTNCILNNDDQLKTSHWRLGITLEFGLKIFQKNPTRSRWGGTFSQNEKRFHKNIKSPSHSLPC